MIQNHKYCIICGQKLNQRIKFSYRENFKRDVEEYYIYICPTKVKVSKLSFPHFESEYDENHNLYQQIIIILPFVISIYKDEVNISKYDNNYNLKLIKSLDSLDLPWNDSEKVLNKLNLYTLFS